MEWDGFGPLVLPFATTCSAPLMEQHVRLAAIDFFSHTKAWQADLQALDADGILTSFAMVLPDDSTIEKLLKVVVTDPYGNKPDVTVTTADIGEDLVHSGTQQLIAYTADRLALTVWPLQADGASIVPKVALKPSLASATLPDAMVEQFGMEIAKGALASLLAMEDKPWTNKDLARLHYVEFNNAKAVTARKVERGFSRGGRRTATRWF